MDLAGEYRIPVSRERVWQALNDPAVIRSCLAGCEEVVKISDNEFSMRIAAEAGAVRGVFTGKVTLSAVDPLAGYTIAAHGHGGAAGFAKGSAKVGLTPAQGNGTILTYLGRAEVGGKLASLGSRALQGVAAKTADDFFTCLIAALAAEAAAPSPPSRIISEPSSPAETLDAAPSGPVPQLTGIQPIAAISASSPVSPASRREAEPAPAPAEAGFRLNAATIIQGMGVIVFLAILAVLFLLR